VTYQVAVCGSRNCTEAESAAAYRVGELPADHGVTILCGGGSGLMAAVATRGL
jgi:predicted Rossmann-fold nucleotide-binding protein